MNEKLGLKIIKTIIQHTNITYIKYKRVYNYIMFET